MAEEQKPVEIPKEETPATAAVVATDAAPVVEPKADETVAPVAGMSLYLYTTTSPPPI